MKKRGLPLTSDELTRYRRQIILPSFGAEGQEKLKNARALVIGLGGLGSPASIYLVAAGVGTLGLADFDAVDVTNLHRQILHGDSRIGLPKTQSGKETLSALNPACRLIAHPSGIRAENLPELFVDYDIIVDCTDNFPARYMACDAAFLAKKPVVYGSILQYEGQASFFNPSAGSPCYRCIFPEMPEPGTVPSCAQAGVCGALCGIIGSIQAMEAIKFITGIGETLSGRLLVVDAATMSFRSLNIKRDPACPLCSPKATIRNIDAQRYEFSCAAEISDGCEITPEKTNLLLESREKPLLIDVRERDEWDEGIIHGALCIPLGTLETQVASLPRDRAIVVYCYSGMRSARAVEMLRSHGFTNTFSMKGGISAWAGPTEAPPGK
jgi:sulfur-carrier protein adenylyltransferase/sulfurtransferase